jgi:hypothetical protein
VAAAQDHDRALTEAGSPVDKRSRIAGHHQHFFMPAMQRALGLQHHEPTQTRAQACLHATVPSIRHAA